MIIELKGLGTKNKGAHLMLLSILEQFRQRNIDSIFCIEPGFGMNFLIAGELGLFLKVKFKGKRLPWNFIMQLLPKHIRRKYGLILDHEIDYVLDASGYAYGDFWGPKKISLRLENVLKGKIKPSCKIILLPQSLGPFNNDQLRLKFSQVINKVTLIFIRDNQSQSFIFEKFPDESKFHLAPDFTNLLEVDVNTEYPEGSVCLIPNYKMLAVDETGYYRFLEESIRNINESEEQPYWLIHEGINDKMIAQKVNANLNLDIPIIEENDPLMIKRRIKMSKLVIVSRFHGLVSALSQGVPTITTSWSHKYLELMKEYNLEASLFDVVNYDSKLLRIAINDALKLDKVEYYQQQRSLIEEQKDKSRKMWDKVFEVIK